MRPGFRRSQIPVAAPTNNMPTGYTHKLMESGQSFRDFALQCARAFGACIEMRDDDFDAPIPEKFAPSDYSVKALAKAERELSRLSRMTPKQRLLFGRHTKRKDLARQTKANQERWEQDARLVNMEREVSKWSPPSPEHAGLRDFMLEQLSISKNGDYWERMKSETKAKDPMQFFTEALASEARNIDYHRKEVAEEIERTNQRNKWIAQLRASLANS